MSTASAPAPPRGTAPDTVEQAPNLAPPPGNPRFPLFDSLRAIAALSVWLGHTVTGTIGFSAHPDLYLLAVQLADQGVAVFFLISGFLLYRPFLLARRGGPRLGLTAFARRRALRIIPAYWAALSVFLALGLVGGVNGGNWWIFYGFGQIYSLSTISHGIGAAWTLCIEVTFYAALPLLSLAAARAGARRESLRGDVALLVVLTAGSLAFRAHYTGFRHFATISTLPGTFTWFAFGMALALASVSAGRGHEIPRALARHPLVCWAAAVAGFVAIHELALSHGSVAKSLIEHVIYAVVALLILLPGVFDDEHPDSARRLLRSRLLAWIGLVSYAFYLYHTIVIQELDKLFAGAATSLRYGLVFVTSFVVSCACAALSYYALERPAMRWGRRGR